MKIFISSDMEGTCGIVDWQETDKGKDLYERFAAQMSREVAAACEGANAAGADDILVKDAHDSARNIDASVLPLNARIFRGWGRHPYSMMAGLDESFDGVVFTGYHSAAEMDTNPLSHTMNLGNNYVKINGELCPELMLNSLTAAYLGVPIYALTGDKGLCDWMKARCPGTTVIPVSEGVGAGSVSIHPALAVSHIREGVEKAFSAKREECMFPLPEHFAVEISFKEHFKAAGAKWYPGCEQTGARTVRFEADDYMDVLRFTYWVL